MKDLFLAAGFWIDAAVEPDDMGYYLARVESNGILRPEIIYWSGSRWQLKGPQLHKVTHWAHICTPTGEEWR